MDEAVEKFKRAIELDPKNENAWNGLGWASFNSGNSPEAQQSLRAGYRAESRPSGRAERTRLTLLGPEEVRLGRNLPVEGCSAWPAAWYGLARLYLLQGKFQTGGKYVQMVVDGGQSDKSADRMLQAAKEKRLPEGLRIVIEPQPVKSELPPRSPGGH